MSRWSDPRARSKRRWAGTARSGPEVALAARLSDLFDELGGGNLFRVRDRMVEDDGAAHAALITAIRDSDLAGTPEGAEVLETLSSFTGSMTEEAREREEAR